MTTEKRTLTSAPELRKDSESRTIRGYAVKYDSETVIGGQFREVFRPGAFKRALEKQDVRALLDHDSGRLLGRMSSGTLRLKEDERGLAVEIDLPDTADGQTVHKLVERGDLSGMSFAFSPQVEVWDETEDMPLREITDADLFEVSAVTFPAYEDTELALRSKEEADKEKKPEPDPKVSAYFRRKAETENKARGI